MKNTFLLLVFMSLLGCSSDNDARDSENTQADPSATKVPEFSSTEIKDIGKRTVTIVGKLTSDGGGSIKERGVVFSKKQDPTVKDEKTEDTSYVSSGKFTTNLKNLQPAQKYYMRMYAINAKGIGYGKKMNFNTEPLNPILFK